MAIWYFFFYFRVILYTRMSSGLRFHWYGFRKSGLHRFQQYIGFACDFGVFRVCTCKRVFSSAWAVETGMTGKACLYTTEYDVSISTQNFRSLANSYGAPETKRWFMVIWFISSLNFISLWDSWFSPIRRFWAVELRFSIRDWFFLFVIEKRFFYVSQTYSELFWIKNCEPKTVWGRSVLIQIWWFWSKTGT